MGKAFEFAPGGAFAYRPGELIVPREHRGRAEDVLGGRWSTKSRPGISESVRRNRFERFEGVRDTLASRERLVEAGVPAQVNHVLFATGCCCHGLCGPHPSTEGAEAFYEAHPFYANPFYANPFYANPFYANPFYANPFYANPFYANSQQNSTGVPRSSATPADQPVPSPEDGRMRVAVLDTGYAKSYEPAAEPGSSVVGDREDEPDLDPQDTYLDTVSGHGTFIAGVVDQLAAECDYRFKRLISNRGDADETEIADALEDLAKLPGRDKPHFVNMSFAGYSPMGMGVLADAVAEALEANMILVASAGNDATCFPTYPAAFPGVVGVGALEAKPDPDDDTKTIYDAATFTNYGPWVRASAPGVDVVSLFFDGFPEPDVGTFQGWAEWSGTSFAAPYVVGKLAARARAIAPGYSDLFTAAAAAVKDLVDDNPNRKLMLGAIVT